MTTPPLTPTDINARVRTGSHNIVSGTYASVSGGSNNTAGSSSPINNQYGDYSSVSGGQYVQQFVDYGFSAGGQYPASNPGVGAFHSP